MIFFYIFRTAQEAGITTSCGIVKYSWTRNKLKCWMTCGSSPFIILFYAQSFVKVCFFGIWGDKKPVLETNMRNGKMSTIRWKNKRRKKVEMSEERIEKYSQLQQEQERQPRRRRKVNGEWREI